MIVLLWTIRIAQDFMKILSKYWKIVPSLVSMMKIHDLWRDIQTNRIVLCVILAILILPHSISPPIDKNEHVNAVMVWEKFCRQILINSWIHILLIWMLFFLGAILSLDRLSSKNLLINMMCHSILHGKNCLIDFRMSFSMAIRKCSKYLLVDENIQV